MNEKELKQLEKERKTFISNNKPPAQPQTTQQSNVTELEQLVKDLTKKVEELEKKVNDSSKLQDDFSGIQIVKREVQYIGKVRNAAGTVVIN